MYSFSFLPSYISFYFLFSIDIYRYSRPIIGNVVAGKKKSVRISVPLERKDYYPGETLELRLKISNNDGKKVILIEIDRDWISIDRIVRFSYKLWINCWDFLLSRLRYLEWRWASFKISAFIWRTFSVNSKRRRYSIRNTNSKVKKSLVCTTFLL